MPAGRRSPTSLADRLRGRRESAIAFLAYEDHRFPRFHATYRIRERESRKVLTHTLVTHVAAQQTRFVPKKRSCYVARCRSSPAPAKTPNAQPETIPPCSKPAPRSTDCRTIHRPASSRARERARIRSAVEAHRGGSATSGDPRGGIRSRPGCWPPVRHSRGVQGVGHRRAGGRNRRDGSDGRRRAG